ncbi:sugar ABC transporter ATP-binding protein [Achromatium sp. WMS1]|nr:sugar ABC transporter ATP-binding protein [Achromatium sp. WMS1]
MADNLVVRHLSKTFRRRQVVKDVSLELNKGEVVGLLGANGAGKTTSFYMIVGLIHPGNGTIILNNKDVTDLPMHARARLGLGYLPQENSSFRKLTVEQNLLAVLEVRWGLRHPDQIRNRCAELLAEFSIEHLHDTLALSLSGGERRRLEIARALAVDPRYVLLDEPFAGIDPIVVNDIKKIVCHLCNHDIGVLITDHNVRETLDICDRAYIIHSGQVIADGTPKELVENPKVREVYLGQNFTM